MESICDSDLKMGGKIIIAGKFAASLFNMAIIADAIVLHCQNVSVEQGFGSERW